MKQNRVFLSTTSDGKVAVYCSGGLFGDGYQPEITSRKPTADTTPKTIDGKSVTDLTSDERKSFLASKRAEGAVELSKLIKRQAGFEL